MQLGLIGTEWWSWEAGGSYEPGDSFDVRVVVYQGRSARQVEAVYPTVKGQSDYRLLPRAAALQYLDKRIAELDPISTGPGEHDFGPLKRSLQRTRAVIVGCLPP